MIIFIFAFIIVLIFPVFLTTYFYIDGNKKQLYFCLKIFSKIKILSGYIQFIKDGIAIHLTKKKAIIIPYLIKFDLQKTYKLAKEYNVIQFFSIIEHGNVDLIEKYKISMLYSSINNLICPIIQYRKQYLKIKNDLILYELNSKIKVTIKLVLVFNLISIISTIIKIILEKISWIEKIE